MMTEKLRISETGTRTERGRIIYALAPLLVALQLSAGQVVLHMKNGDRIAGQVVSETEQELVVSTPWAKALSLPRDQIERREELASAPGTNAPVAAAASPTNAPAPAPVQTAAAPTKPVKPKAASEWKFDARFGADMIRGQRDRDIYYSQLALNYSHPYESNPKKYFRNKLDYRVDYGTTDGEESANRMFGSDKTDFDVGEKAYAYNNVAGGFDEVRKINSQIEAGPGGGYHLLRKPAIAANIEGGVTYQYQDREGAPELDSLYGRLGQDCTWKVYPKIPFTQRSSFLASLEECDQLQFRLEANLSFGIVQNLSLNLTAVELYDTRPVPGVTKNEFQLRSSLGLTF